jgi:hypothetical protein
MPEVQSMPFPHTYARRTGLASLIVACGALFAIPAKADTAPSAPRASCDPAALRCTTQAVALRGKIGQELGPDSEIDSGWLDQGLVKIRTRFSMQAGAHDEPLLLVDMPNGATVEASWSDKDKGSIVLRPLSGEGVVGSVNVHYTLVPRLEANIYGTSINYNATDLLAKIPGSSFNYDARATTTVAPWGFAGASATVAPPSLDTSTVFSLAFADLGIDPGTVEGSLAIQAAARPTFKYLTKEVMFDSTSVTTADGSAKIAVADADSIDVSATISGELTLSGSLDIRPVVTIDTVDGLPTFGLVHFSFSAVSKPFGGAPTPVVFDHTQIHIPLPNVKVPQVPLDMGSMHAGDQVSKSVSIDSTGDMDGLLMIESDNPQFVVPSGAIRAPSKSKYDLQVTFKPSSDGPASATITVRSNDPDSPEQSFRVAANGAPLEAPGQGASTGAGTTESKSNAPSSDSGAPSGCGACSAVGSASRVSRDDGALALVAFGIVGSFARRRGRRASRNPAS